MAQADCIWVESFPPCVEDSLSVGVQCGLEAGSRWELIECCAGQDAGMDVD